MSLLLVVAMISFVSLATGNAQTIAKGMANYASNASATASRFFGRVNFAPAKALPVARASAFLGDGNAPVITAGGTFFRIQGSGASSFTIATVSDTDSEVSNLIVRATLVPAGITINSIKNTNGTITADLAANCTAAFGNNAIELTVTDDTSLTATDNVTLFVKSPESSTLGNYTNTSVVAGGNTNVIADASPSGASGVSALASVGFSGTLAVNSVTGAVMVTNAGPASIVPYTITVQVTSGCEVTTKTFTLTVNDPSSCTSAGFATKADLPAGNQPGAAAIGDFNGDGEQDLLLGNYMSNTVSVRLGDGLGSFSGTTEISVGTNPQSVATGDFNGDGREDFAAVNYNTNYVSIRLGDGTGNFTSVSNVTVGVQPYSVATGDFNGDGKQDLAVTNTDPGTVSIRLGDGAGYFTTVSDVAVGSYPTWIAIADFNNDGKQDFATANLDSDNVSVRLGNGDGTFVGTTTIDVHNPISVAIGDFNKDGNDDFAAANYSGGKVSIQLGDGAGNFVANGNITVGNFPASVALGDFNGDGNQDLAAANLNSSTVSILIGDGIGSFPSLPEIMTGDGPKVGIVGDFNGDGKQDIVTGNGNDNTISVLLSDCTGGVEPTITLQPISTTVFAGMIATFTVAADGIPTPTVQWMESTDGGSTFNAIAFATNTSLNHVAAFAHNGYQYYAVVTNNSGSVNSSVATLTVNRRATNTELSTSLNPSAFGQMVTFTASVSIAPTAETTNASGPTGAVIFYDGKGTIVDCTERPITNGVATCVTDAFTVGDHTVSAQYLGDSKYDVSNGALPGNPQVVTGAPTLVPSIGLTVVQGSPLTNLQIATVSDDVATPGNVSVSALSVPDGLLVTNIVNTNGIITADIEAVCSSLIGNNAVVLEASDGKALSSTASLVIDVTGNPEPTLGNYEKQTVVLDCKLIVTPDAAPADNIGVTSVTATGSSLFIGSIEVAPSTGVVTILNNGPVGFHMITVTVTDNCGLTSQKTFSVEVLAPPTAPTAFDFDGDRKADIAVYRKSVSKPSYWYILRSSDGVVQIEQLGQPEDIIVPGDYDGDGNTSVAVYRPSTSTWYTSVDPSTNFGEFQWGQAGDIPVPGYYDADNKMDIAVFRPSTGTWYVANSTGGSDAIAWGQDGDKLVPADYDGDGRTDLAVWRPSDGNWYIQLSGGGSTIQHWGATTDVAVPADFDGDGKNDVAVWRPSTGIWYILNSNVETYAQEWGQLGDVPTPADYDNDGRADLAVYRPSQGYWYISKSCQCTYRAEPFGIETDTPLSSAFTPIAGK